MFLYKPPRGVHLVPRSREPPFVPIAAKRVLPIPSVMTMTVTETSTRVLVVDDEPQVVWMLQFSLEAEGYQTYSARDGVQNYVYNN